MIVCPFCVTSQNLGADRICSHCRSELPVQYTNQSQRIPPIWLITVGFPQHGKTTYLSALTLLLENLVHLWPEVSVEALGEYTSQQIKTIRRQDKLGETPERTATRQADEPHQPLIFNVNNLPSCGTRCVVMYDIAGELFDDPKEVETLSPVLSQVDTIWFLVSLDDLENDEQGRGINDLFNSYTAAMDKARAQLAGRNLVVVYTKGDKLRRPNMRDYLLSDPLQGCLSNIEDPEALAAFDQAQYERELRDVSEKLRSFTRTSNVQGGAAFIRLAEERGLNLEFAITAALSGASERDADISGERFMRARVIDPFLFAMNAGEVSHFQRIRLVIDHHDPQSEAFPNRDTFEELVAQLSSYGDVEIFQLGNTRPIPLGHAFAKARPPSNRLIGPILDGAGSDDLILIVLGAEVFDLSDYRYSPTGERILLAWTGTEQPTDWRQPEYFLSREDSSRVVETLLGTRTAKTRV